MQKGANDIRLGICQRVWWYNASVDVKLKMEHRAGVSIGSQRLRALVLLVLEPPRVSPLPLLAEDLCKPLSFAI